VLAATGDAVSKPFFFAKKNQKTLIHQQDIVILSPCEGSTLFHAATPPKTP
jgi:hypothetical protein